MKIESIIPPLVIVGAIGIIGYAIMAKPATSSPATATPLAFNGLGNISTGNSITNPTAPSYAEQTFNAGSLQMPSNVPALQLPSFNLPAIAVGGVTTNNYNQASCPSGCANF